MTWVIAVLLVIVALLVRENFKASHELGWLRRSHDTWRGIAMSNGPPRSPDKVELSLQEWTELFIARAQMAAVRREVPKVQYRLQMSLPTPAVTQAIKDLSEICL
jgi:uncharacterized membrane protein